MIYPKKRAYELNLSGFALIKQSLNRMSQILFKILKWLQHSVKLGVNSYVHFKLRDYANLKTGQIGSRLESQNLGIRIGLEKYRVLLRLQYSFKNLIKE